jgi:hypothetical protein
MFDRRAARKIAIRYDFGTAGVFAPGRPVHVRLFPLERTGVGQSEAETSLRCGLSIGFVASGDAE